MSGKTERLLENTAIVIVLLLVLSAVVFIVVTGPRHLDTEVRSALSQLRNGLEQYKNDHGSYPGGTGEEVIERLVKWTNAAGEVGPGSVDYQYAPRLPTGIPVLPVGVNKGSSQFLVVEGTPEPDETSEAGWVYSPETGEIIANTTAKDKNGKPYAEY